MADITISAADALEMAEVLQARADWLMIDADEYNHSPSPEIKRIERLLLVLKEGSSK